MGQPDGQLVVLTTTIAQQHNDLLVVIKILSARFWFVSRVLLVSQFPPAPDFLEFLNQRGLPALHQECPCTSAMGWVIDGGRPRAGPKSDSDTVAGTRQDNGGVKNSN